jgi:hypothetical protein
LTLEQVPHIFGLAHDFLGHSLDIHDTILNPDEVHVLSLLNVFVECLLSYHLLSNELIQEDLLD